MGVPLRILQSRSLYAVDNLVLDYNILSKKEFSQLEYFKRQNLHESHEIYGP